MQIAGSKTLSAFLRTSAELMLATFRDIRAEGAADGVEFDVDARRVDRIRQRRLCLPQVVLLL
ncbi:hypothetical protein ACQZ4Y_18910 [Rhizobium sp. L80/93]|uniref:hypothetical protein n=1 Tax=unclassified Rhizobium TaxID=2613769 RepID=UPI001ADB63FB|nr:MULTISPECIES: hypothetical protein [unclassified Rhizobium]QXZ92698.1 hypothetical protein J5280_18670 [Rhizobium sp. K15/93]MBO9101232.1 hypothetical protein [Rhizobium sp. L58/93]MBO9186691.1 hypothetical protein [Rhizobium sp. E27B/91]QXZ87269.1 hypothetical protein J5287_22225 [Rhizobium sp. K1/93]QYA04083.1 hypothetical protein J5278_25420 [Rhizobium sp. B21/90]